MTAKAISQAVEGVMVPAPAVDEVVDPADWFKGPDPQEPGSLELGRLELEIGCGKGRFLLHRARSRPDLRLFGVEWANKFYLYAADRMARWGVTNVRLMRADAEVLVKRNLPPSCLRAMHIYHPDPWPKKRHHKRRLIQAPFIKAVLRVLVPGGRLLLQTDHEEYYAWMCEVLSGFPGLAAADPDDPEYAPGEGWEGTNFEVKYLRERRPIYRMAFAKRA